MAFFSFPERVNERAARLVATGVVATLALAWLADLPWLVGVLAVGFLLRVGWGPRFSPLARMAMFVSAKLWEVRPVSGAPKRFAQGIGAVFTLAASALFASGMASAGWALLSVMAVFASLEAGLGFCAGCWVYGRLQALGVFPADACVDCRPGATPT